SYVQPRAITSTATCSSWTAVGWAGEFVDAESLATDLLVVISARATSSTAATANRMGIKLKPKSECRWDLVSLGEVMLRLDPGDGRIQTARSFQVWEGGGEYNVARGLRRCFGMDTAIVTALADNPVGHLVEDLTYQGGVDQSHVKWVKYDGVGRSARNGLNFTERGF